MMVVDVYSQYFAADCVYNGVPRHAAIVFLQSDSEAGNITYSANVSFFPHNDENDFSVSYDAVRTEVLFQGKGRRSKKKEAAYMAELHARVDALAAQLGGKVFWDKPLREARLA